MRVLLPQIKSYCHFPCLHLLTYFAALVTLFLLVRKLVFDCLLPENVPEYFPLYKPEESTMETNGSITAVAGYMPESGMGGSALVPTDCLLADFMQPYPKCPVQDVYPPPWKPCVLYIIPFIRHLF